MKKWHQILIHLPGLLILVVSILGFIPMIEPIESVQNHIPIIAKVILVLIGVLVTAQPEKVMQLVRISVAEARMKQREKSLLQRENRVAILTTHYNNAQNAISAGNIN